MNEQIRGEIIEAGQSIDDGVPVVVIRVTEKQLTRLTRNPLYRPAVITIDHQEDE